MTQFVIQAFATSTCVNLGTPKRGKQCAYLLFRVRIDLALFRFGRSKNLDNILFNKIFT